MVGEPTPHFRVLLQPVSATGSQVSQIDFDDGSPVHVTGAQTLYGALHIAAVVQSGTHRVPG